MSKYVCPRCFTEQDTNDVEYICTNISRSNPCPRQKSHTPFKPDNLKSPVCDKCGQPVMTRVCPKCGFELPNNIENTVPWKESVTIYEASLNFAIHSSIDKFALASAEWHCIAIPHSLPISSSISPFLLSISKM